MSGPANKIIFLSIFEINSGMWWYINEYISEDRCSIAVLHQIG